MAQNIAHSDIKGATRKEMRSFGQILKRHGAMPTKDGPTVRTLRLGADDSINIGTLSYSNNITLEAWVNTTNPTGWDDIIAGGCGDLLFGINSAGNGTLSWGGQCNVPFSPVTSTISITDGNWHHVIGTYNGSVAALYIDGNLEVSGARSGNFTPGNIAIGSVGGGGEHFNGKIANVRIYNKALTASEVQQNYQATKDKFQGQQIITNGLVLNLDSANKDSYPGTGTTWTDLSGNGNNGTLLNGVAFNANKNGGVMYFDDTDDTVSIGNSSLFSITNAMTVFAWVNPSSTSGWDGIFGGSISGFVHFQLYLGTINIYIYGPNASYSNNDSYNVPANAWISIGFTYDGTTLKVYVNGSQLATTIAGSGNVTSNSDVRVGWAYDTSRVFGGYIGTTQVYNRALSATEITQNYNATKTRFGL